MKSQQIQIGNNLVQYHKVSSTQLTENERFLANNTRVYILVGEQETNFYYRLVSVVATSEDYSLVQPGEYTKFEEDFV
jgi:hypothetical protein